MKFVFLLVRDVFVCNYLTNRNFPRTFQGAVIAIHKRDSETSIRNYIHAANMVSDKIDKKKCYITKSWLVLIMSTDGWVDPTVAFDSTHPELLLGSNELHMICN